ncbi:MAG: flagellar biosynthetic protein FliR [Pseudomonadota bacterium]
MIGFTEAQLLAWITPLLWPFIRTLALFSSLPMLGARNVPARVRVALSALIVLCAQPVLPPMPQVPLDSPLAFMLVVQQVLIGVTIGFAVRVVLAAVEYAGELIGLQMGLNFAAFFDPITNNQATSTSRLFNTTVSWLFIVVNGHLLVVMALVDSFTAFPVGPEPFAFLRKALPHQWGAEIFGTGLWIALPLVAMMVFINVSLGVISRVAPQLSLFSVGFPITIGVGLVGLVFTLPAMNTPFMMVLERLLTSLR